MMSKKTYTFQHSNSDYVGTVQAESKGEALRIAIQRGYKQVRNVEVLTLLKAKDKED